MAEFTLTALKSEIDNDPQGIGYKDGANWLEDSEIADLLNNVIVSNTITRFKIEAQGS